MCLNSVNSPPAAGNNIPQYILVSRSERLASIRACFAFISYVTGNMVFSEYLLEKSVASSISILPKTFSPISVQYKGKKLIISLPDDLLDNQTYILLINRDLKDENGVSIDEGIQLAFSTGDIIDTSELSGRIFSDGEASCLLWKIKDSTDQSDFFKRLPDYSIDANDKGVYKFNYLFK